MAWKCPAMSAGPEVRAGFTEPPVTGLAISMPQARAKPTARGYARRDPVVGGDRDHHEDQDKGDQELHRECPEVPTLSGERGCQEGYLSYPGPVGDPGAIGS